MWHMTPRTHQSLGELLDPIVECFTPEVARRLVRLKASPKLQSRVDHLADKANEGKLTPKEEAEYRTYIEAAEIIGIFQAKARRFLAQQSS
jgi:hypothetical protein